MTGYRAGRQGVETGNAPGSIQAALDSIGTLNKLDANGRRPIRIHAIGFPEGPGMSPFTNIRFSALMRLVTEQNNGTFVGLRQ